MIKEFKDFIMRGNVLDLAVAVIIAGAFGAIVTTFTQNVMMPPIGYFLGGVDFSDLAFVIDPGTLNAETGALEGRVAIEYGLLINKVIDFLIVGFILFMIIKAYNKANPPEEKAPAPPAGPTDIELLTEIRDLLKK